MAAAEKAIIADNEIWGDFLTEQHLRGNEFDLDEMRSTFGKMDEKFKNRGVSRAVLQSHHASLVGYRSYTERFVKDYGLDDEQVEAAMSILGEIEAQAKTHLASVKNQEDATSKR